MIRRSGTIALAALLLSLAVHLLLGLGITWRVPPEPQPEEGETTTQVITPGREFEDVAETASEPAPPEPAIEPKVPEAAAEPEPSAAEEPVPDETEVPSSEVHIASDAPQQTRTPDGETSQAVEITEETGAAPSEDGETPQPATTEPVGAEDGEAPDADLTPPSGADTVTDIAQGQPDAPSEPSEAVTQTTEVSPAPTEPTSTPTSTPVTAVPAPPATAVPVTPSVPVVSLQPAEIAPQTPLETIEAAPDPTDTAVKTSLRPQLPTKRPPPPARGTSDSSSQTRTTRLAPSRAIESPLTAYKRTGSNIFGQRGGGARSGGQGFRNSNNGGNSDRTNYAGLVLTQLNRAPFVAASGRGWAVVLFRINPNGTLNSVSVIDSSGSTTIDRAAQQTVRAAGRFPRTPDGQAKTLTFTYRNR